MDNHSKQSYLSFPLTVPVAIIVAGALIAGAVYFGRGDSGSTRVSNQQVGNNQVNDVLPRAPEAPPEPTIGNIRPVTDADHIRGAKNAKVTIIEYSDLECPFCKRFHPTMQRIVEEYPSDVRWVYRHFPLEQLHSKAPKEAEATECAGEQGKFWEFTDKIFEVTPSNDGLDLDELPQLARDAGVSNIAQFEACLDSGKYAQRVEDDLADAAIAGGQGTPHSVVLTPDGQKIPIQGAQPYSAVKQIVDQALSG